MKQFMILAFFSATCALNAMQRSQSLGAISTAEPRLSPESMQALNQLNKQLPSEHKQAAIFKSVAQAAGAKNAKYREKARQLARDKARDRKALKRSEIEE